MKKTNKLLIHLGVLSLSAIILGIGCVFFIRSSLGSDAMTTMMNGMEKKFGLSLSQCNLIINMIMIVAAFIIDRKQIGIGSVVYPILSSQGISIGLLFIPVLAGYMRLIGFLLGIILLSLAIAISSKTECGKNPYDAVCFAIIGKQHVKYNLVRSSIDAFMLITGVILGGTYGLGTLITVFSIGSVAMLFMNVINKWDWFMNSLNKGEKII